MHCLPDHKVTQICVIGVKERKMGSRSKAVLNSRFPIVKKVEVEDLKGLASLMGSEDRDLFNKTYGNLLRLLQLDVQESAVIALSQFYDPDIRSFLFEDFQLAPTIEEYDQILGFSKSGLPPYQYQKHQYTDQRLSLLLQVGLKELELHKEKKNHIVGFPLNYFGSLLRSYAQASKWGPFRQLLALTIFGIILFPQIEKFIDENAIGIFLAFIDKKNPVNPVYAVLADTYYSFTLHRVLGKRKIACSLHVLYAWLLNHVTIHNKKAADLMGYALSCDVGVQNAQEWVHAFKDLSALRVNWFTRSCWKDRPSILFQCGDFQNVPLVGTRGCINYNPSLTIRQLGYPMKNAPAEDMLACIFFDKDDPKNQALFWKITKAWESPLYKDKEEVTKRSSEVTFYQWLQKRIQDVRPSPQNALIIPKEEESSMVTLEEFDKIKTALPKLEEEKKVLQDKLEGLMSEKRKLESEGKCKDKALEEHRKKLKKEEESKQQVRGYLQRTRDELEKSNAKVGEAMARENEWRELFKESVAREKMAKKSLAECKEKFRAVTIELEGQLRCVQEDKDSIERVLREYKQVLRLEQEDSDELKRNLRHISDAYRQVREESRYWEHRYWELVRKIKEQEVVEELRAEAQHWRGRFSQLAWLANQAVRDVPRRIKRAEAEMLPCNTPVQVYEFVEFCKMLTEELMDKARGAAAADKEEKKEEKLKAICP